ncbi:MAG: ATP-binding protein [Bacteroidota bacterium]
MTEPVISSSPNGHSVQFYEDDCFLCDEVARFASAGLDQGEAVVIVASERHLRPVADALSAAGRDLDGLRSSGHLLALDAEQTLECFMDGGLAHGLPDERSFRGTVGSIVARLCADTGFRGVRAYGEMVDLLVELGNVAGAERLEELWNDLARSHRFSLLCGYSMRHFRSAGDSEAFGRLCNLHGHVHPSETYDERWTADHQRRRVAELQQRSSALESEIADRRKLEAALRDEQDRLRAANRHKDEFIARLSHELRNPLAPILTSLDLMDLRGDATSWREREIIRRQARHLATLLEDLLDVSRAASGKISLQKQLVEFAQIADAALEMTSPLFQERRHMLELSVPGEGLLLEADPVRLSQVVANLLSNAAKYTPIGGLVSLSAERQGAEIVVTVEDNGVGIPRETLGDMFAPFTQARQDLDRSMGGLGLGLALVRSLTQLHGGTASAESDGVGKGSRFTLRFPAAPTHASPRPPRRARHVREGRPHDGAARPGPEARRHADTRYHVVDAEDAACAGPVDVTTEDGDGHRILIVDDNRDAAASMGRLVEHLGFDVRIAHDGKEAIRIAKEFAPESALVDIGLPNMDGYAVATRLRRVRKPGRMRLIAVTGYGQAADRERSALAGFDAHAVKPVGIEMLWSLLLRIPEVKGT